MNNQTNLKFDILEEVVDGKIVATEKKMKDNFLVRYVITALVPLTIYRLIVNIIQDKYFKQIFDYQFSLSSIEQFTQSTINYSYKILIFSIILMLLDFLVVLISSISTFKKYKIKKENIKGIMKTIIIVQLIFAIVHSFFFGVNYIDNKGTNESHISIYERLVQKQNDNKQDEYNIYEYLNKVDENINVHFVIVIIVQILCTILCILFQKKILKINSV